MRTIKETLIEIQTTSVEITVYEELESIVKSMIMPPADTLRFNRINSRTVISEGYYYVPDDIIVEEDGELIIEPGVQLNFAQGKGIVALGKLFINGTADNLVIITGKGWSNISIVGEKSEGSVVSNAVIYDGNGRDKIPGYKHGFYDNRSSIVGGNLLTELTHIELSNIILIKGKAEIGGGLYCGSCFMIADNLIVYKNEANSGGGGGGITIASPREYKCSYSKLINSKIISNFSTGTGGIYIFRGHLIVDQSIIKHNVASWGCGGLELSTLPSDHTDIRIANSIIENNTGTHCGGINYQNSKPLGDDVLSNIIRNNISTLDYDHNMKQW